MDTGLEVKQKIVKELTKELVIGGGDLDVYIDLFIDDKKILTKKSDSLLANFLKMLYAHMGGWLQSGQAVSYYKFLGTFNVSSVSSGSGSVVRLTLASSISGGANGICSIGGVSSVDLNGRYSFNYINTTTIDLVNTYYSACTVTSLTVNLYIPATTQDSGNALSYYSFYMGSDSVFVGTGTTPVSIDDQTLHKQVPNRSTLTGSLVHGTVSISVDTNDSTSAQVQITRIFTNTSTSSVTVSELGILGQTFTNMNALMLRDILGSPITVAAGKVLTVNYRIKTTLGTGANPGGFVTNFMRLLYRHIARTSRVAIDVNNVNSTVGGSSADFKVTSCGGYNYNNAVNTEPGWKCGPVLGMGTTAVSMDDYYLNNVIAHGTGTNQLLYSGTIVQNFAIADGGISASFDIIKYAENASGADIAVNEIALIGGGNGGDTANTAGGDNHSKLYMIARNVLDTPFTIPNGQMVKIVYKIKVVL